MPRGRVPSLLSLNNGGIIFVIAQRACKCCRCKNAIIGGTKCGDLKKLQSGFSRTKRHCLVCVAEIIAKTQAELDEIRNAMETSL